MSLPSEDEEEELKLNGIWEYAINDLFQLSPVHAEGKSLRNWVKFQEMDTIVQFYEWAEQDIAIGTLQTSYKENSWGKHMLWKYLHHLVNKAKESSTLVDSFPFLEPEGSCQLTRKEFMTWRLEHSSQQRNLHTGNGPIGYTQQDSRYESN